MAVLTSARLKAGRLGALRLKYVPVAAAIIIGGSTRTHDVRVGSMIVRDILNDTPNTATFSSGAPAPVTGQSVVMSYPGIPGGLFGGAIERVEEQYESRKENLIWRVTCSDYTRQLLRKRINKAYIEQSATAIATDLIVGTGITGTFIVAGLPVVTGGIDFVDMPARDALSKLMQRVGGYWYVDYGKALHAFLSETTSAPDPLLPWPQTPTLMNDPPITYDEDITQLRNRIIVTGGGSTTVIPIVAGASLVPLQDTSLFATSGELKSGTQRYAYTGRVLGGAATNVGSSVAAPSSAPSASISTTVGGRIVGSVSYRYTYKNASGETLVSPASNTVTGVAFAEPSGPSASPTSGLGRLVGSYSWRTTFVTDKGETTPSAPSSILSLLAFAPPTAPSLSSSALGPLVGAYSYVCTFVTQYGETTAGTTASRTANAITTPSAPSLNEASSVQGPLIGSYSYRVSMVTAFGETLPGTAGSLSLGAQGEPSGSWFVNSFAPGPLIGAYSYKLGWVSPYGETVSGSAASLTCLVVTSSSPSVSGDGTGASIAYSTTYVHPVYGESALSVRTVDTNKGTSPVVFVNGLPSGCGWNVYSTGTSATASTDPLFKVGQLPIGVSSFTHTTQTGPGEGVVPGMGRWVQLTGIPAGPSGTTSRRIYRTKAGGSTYYLVGEIANNSGGVSFNDATPDDSLSVMVPSSSANGKQVQLSSIPTGPSGTFARRIYRTKSGGSTAYLLAQLSDNSTTTLTDNVPDALLSQVAPLVGFGGEQITVTIPTGPSGTLGRRVYRTLAGSASYRLLVDVPDNGTTTILDTVVDASLSPVVVPVVSTAGGQNVLVGIPTGPTGTLARRIYRTRAGGAGGEWLLAGQVSDNASTSYTDSVPDASLGRTAPIVNDAGASAVNVTVPTGPAGVTSRRVYRTEAGKSVYRFVSEIRDNSTTSLVDIKADTELGDVPPDVATIGALAGSTTLGLIDASAFATAGWARIDSQVITWSNKTSTSLTGIPASGDGSLKSAVSAGTSIVALPMLTGVSGLGLALVQGDAVNLLVQRDDTTQQAALAVREGFGTGIIEYAISDSKLSATEATARADAELALFAKPIGRLRYTSRDLKTASGKTVTANIPELGLNGSFVIQSVTIDEIGIAGNRAAPRFTVEASTVRFSLDDAIRRLVAGLGGL